MSVAQFTGLNCPILYVGNLPLSASGEMVYDRFAPYGTIRYSFVYDPPHYDVEDPNRVSRYAIVSYREIREANLAIDNVNGSMWMGSRLFVGSFEPFRNPQLSGPVRDVYVTRFNERLTYEIVWQGCSAFGRIEHMLLERDVYGYRFALVRYATVEAAEGAINQLNRPAALGGAGVFACKANRIRCGGPVCPATFRWLQLQRMAGYTVTISGLPATVGAKDLHEKFQMFGPIQCASVEGNGTGSVRYEKRESANRAIQEWNDSIQFGSAITLIIEETNDVELDIAIPEDRYVPDYNSEEAWNTGRNGTYANYPMDEKPWSDLWETNI